MLRYPYHLRYELLEFAVYTLAARTQGLVPLHAACIGHGGHGVLLLGDSSSGKSTVALHCLLNGLEFLAEDSVLVEPRTLRATGVANFLHLRSDSLRWLTRKSDLARVRRSPLIRRRSGARKFELDLRQGGYPLRAGTAADHRDGVPVGAAQRGSSAPARPAARRTPATHHRLAAIRSAPARLEFVLRETCPHGCL